MVCLEAARKGQRGLEVASAVVEVTEDVVHPEEVLEEGEGEGDERREWAGWTAWWMSPRRTISYVSYAHTCAYPISSLTDLL
jgi:hypothetical protein